MKYLCLDLGNVIVEVNFKPFLDSLSKSLNIGLNDATYFLNRTQKLHDLGLTCISDELRDHFKIESPVIIDELMHEWNSSIRINLPMLDAMSALSRTHNVRIAILSNIGVEHLSLMRKILGFGELDKAVKFYSCEVGARKPSLLYYKTFLDMHPEFKNAVYIDDRMENLEAGNKFGFKGVHLELDKCSHKELKQKIEDISKLFTDDIKTTEAR